MSIIPQLTSGEKVSSSEHYKGQMSCLICYNSVDQDEGKGKFARDDGGVALDDEIEQGFSLVCKLLNVIQDPETIRKDTVTMLTELEQLVFGENSNTGDNCNDEQNRTTISTCASCAKFFLEIVRLEENIKKMKMMQLVQADCVKRLLLKSGEKYLEIDARTSSDFWKVARRQLFECVTKQNESVIERQQIGNFADSCNISSRRKPVSSSRQNNYSIYSPKSSSAEKMPYSLVEKLPMPGSAVLTRLEDVKKNGESGSISSATACSSRQAILRNSLNDEMKQETESSDSDLNNECAEISLNWDGEEDDDSVRCESLIKSEFPVRASFPSDTILNACKTADGGSDVGSKTKLSCTRSKARAVTFIRNYNDEDFNDSSHVDSEPHDLDFLPSFEDLKQEIEEDVGILDEMMSTGAEGERMEPLPRKGKDKTYKTNFRVYTVQKNLWLFRNTAIKFCPDERHYLCQEPGCASRRIPGSILDGSIFANINSHVLTEHRLFEHRKQKCVLCSENCTGSAGFKKHLVKQHTFYTGQQLQEPLAICSLCGKPNHSFANLSHLWTHKSFDEQVTAIKAGCKVPKDLLKKVESNSRHRLYPLLFGATPTLPTDSFVEPTAVVEKLRTARLDIVYRLEDKTTYLARYSLFSLSVRGLFQCQEPECSYTISEWEDRAVLKLKTHCIKMHDRTTDLYEKLGRVCPICQLSVEGHANFRMHMVKAHLNSECTAICEICCKPLSAQENYWIHIRTHRNQQGEDSTESSYPDDNDILPQPQLKSVMSKRQTKPSPISLPTKKSKQQEILRKEDINKVGRQSLTCRKILHVTNSTLLYKGTLLSVEGNGSQIRCLECQQCFIGGTLDFFQLFTQLKIHVDDDHLGTYEISESHVECPVCGENLQGRINLRRHILQTHGSKSSESGQEQLLNSSWVICEVCMKPTYNAYNTSGKHLWTHMNFQEKVLAAIEAVEKKGGRVPVTEAELKVLVEERTKELDMEVVSCEHCGRTFSCRRLLHHHLPIHEERSKTWMCSECGNSYLSLPDLRSHEERMHKPELKKTRQCPEPGCGKVFYARDTSKFNGHVMRHRGEAPIVCDLCGKGFQGKYQLNYHQKQVHFEKGKYKCECGKGYSTSNHLKRHRQQKQHYGDNDIQTV